VYEKGAEGRGATKERREVRDRRVSGGNQGKRTGCGQEMQGEMETSQVLKRTEETGKTASAKFRCVEH
jgi:hypothetical protein